MRPLLVQKVFPKSDTERLSYRILRYVHGTLNIDEKKLIAQFDEKSRDEHLEPN